MIYLDYSATTPVDEEILNSFSKTCRDYVGNVNSLHALGIKARKLEIDATKQIASILNVLPSEIIYTSGATEANNLAIKGIAFKYQNRGKHIITTNLEHSSVYGPIGYLQTLGFTVDFVDTDQDGIINLDHLNSLIREDTLLISIASVNSETGLLQPIEAIGKLIKKHPKCFFHVDMTQSIGKINIDLEDVDLASFSAHKFYGIKGIGALIKKENIVLEPLMHGGKSTTIFRSGTPALPLVVSLAKALRFATNDLDLKFQQISLLNKKIKEELSKEEGISINSNDKCIPHILNISIDNVKPETMLHALSNKDIYISTQSACSHTDISKAVFELTKDSDKAKKSMRISLSHITTIEEVTTFIKTFNECFNNLNFK